MNRAFDWRSDLYALGATLFHLLTGRPPFEAIDPLEMVHAHLARRPPLADDPNPVVPAVVSQIVAKLQAKNAEDRYQSSAAVADDLEHAARDLAEADDPAFAIASNDRVDRFALPQRLYGRDVERQRLLDAFDEVAQGGRKQLPVAGYSGVGKSSLVNEIQRPIVQRRGHFIAGKFDQLARNVPYASLIQAFRELVRQLLAEPAEVLLAYRRAIVEAIAPNGQVIVDVIAEVQWIIGAQPAVPELPPAEALNRLHVVYEAFAWTVRAHQAYSVWGARTKAAQLWSDHDLEVAAVTSAARAPTQAMRAATVQHRAANGVIASQPVVTTSSRTAADLDLDSVLKASQTIAGEVVFDKLLAKMMAVVIENGGAERVVLLAVDHDHIEVTAQMATGDHNVPRDAMPLADAIA